MNKEKHKKEIEDINEDNIIVEECDDEHNIVYDYNTDTDNSELGELLSNENEDNHI